ncbi:transposase [Portibacter lacus]|uniref:Transposase IS200-like domain-containing protein n=1 Tax=Portibacter lacus TaxID=1099794 RepID=A0AA37WF94_9BACT|nr:transposase [Portibacter lacus]GLR19721.1 hypothetical protein GCM10007940_43370 [Portibacter lacus]
MENEKIFYKRNLPHIQTVGAIFFITCSLKGSISKNKLAEIREEYNLRKTIIDDSMSKKEINYQKYFARRKYILDIDNIIHENKGPSYLDSPANARILLERIESYHKKYYNLLAVTIMSNHFHMLIDTSVQLKGNLVPDFIPENYVQLDKVMKLIKGGSAKFINEYCKTPGRQVWENESFDIYIRNEKMLSKVVGYILNNPVKAGIVNTFEEHPFTFVAEEISY